MHIRKLLVIEITKQSFRLRPSLLKFLLSVRYGNSEIFQINFIRGFDMTRYRFQSWEENTIQSIASETHIILATSSVTGFALESLFQLVGIVAATILAQKNSVLFYSPNVFILQVQTKTEVESLKQSNIKICACKPRTKKRSFSSELCCFILECFSNCLFHLMCFSREIMFQPQLLQLLFQLEFALFQLGIVAAFQHYNFSVCSV